MFVGSSIKTVIIKELQTMLSGLSSHLLSLTSNTLTIIGSIFGSLIYFLTILLLTLYLVIDKHATEEFIKSVSPRYSENYALHVINKIKKKMGGWMRGQFILSIVLGVLTYICLTLIDFKYALIIAILTGVMEIIPVVGFWSPFSTAVILAFLQDPILGFITVITFVVLQTFESHIMVPIVMKHSVGLSPVVIILAMLAGAQLFGLAGLILAVPVAASLSILITEYTKGS
jgi:predicted PurR-regulated permease PerM